MLVSLITVSRNAAGTIEDCCRSALAQTGVRFQRIHIDGGSTDGTCDIIRNHLRPGDVLVSESDRGIYDAMNKGLARATGDIVGFLNADDALAGNRALATVVRSIQGKDLVYGNLVYLAKSAPETVVRYWNSHAFRAAHFRLGVMPPHPTVYCRRSLLDRMGPFRTDMRMAADFEFCCRAFRQPGIRVAHIPEILVKMRLGGESNRSWSAVIRQNYWNLVALRHNGLLPSWTYGFHKVLDKARQFVERPRTPSSA